MWTPAVSEIQIRLPPLSISTRCGWWLWTEVVIETHTGKEKACQRS